MSTDKSLSIPIIRNGVEIDIDDLTELEVFELAVERRVGIEPMHKTVLERSVAMDLLKHEPRASGPDRLA